MDSAIVYRCRYFIHIFWCYLPFLWYFMSCHAPFLHIFYKSYYSSWSHIIVIIVCMFIIIYFINLWECNVIEIKCVDKERPCWMGEVVVTTNMSYMVIFYVHKTNVMFWGGNVDWQTRIKYKYKLWIENVGPSGGDFNLTSKQWRFWHIGWKWCYGGTHIEAKTQNGGDPLTFGQNLKWCIHFGVKFRHARGGG